MKNTLLAMPIGNVSIRWATASATHAIPVMKPASSAQVTGSPKSSNTVLVNTTETIALSKLEGLLRAFLNHLDHDPAAVRLADEGGSAFVSLSLRPFVVAALADQDAKRPALIVVGDDRAARDLAADLRAWLAPRPVRYYPSRGVAYESHLTPPPHLVGLRVAALDALTDTPEGSEQPVVVICATALSEKVPDPKLRPHGFMLRVGDLIDLDETAQQLVAAGYQRVDQVEDRGQFAIRGGLLDVYPATEERAVRVDCSTSRSRRCAGSRPSPSAAWGRPTASRSRPPPSWRPSTASWPRSPPTDEDRPDIAELLPVDHFRALLDLIPERTQVIIAADEDVEPTLRDHWEDVCTAFDDQDARDLYVNPAKINEALADPRRGAPDRASRGDQPIQIRGAGRRLRRAQPARGRVRAREARPLATTRRSSPGRRSAPPSAPPTTSTASRRRLNGSTPRPRLHRGQPARRLRRPRPQARRVPRAPADPPQEGLHAADAQGPRPAALASPTCARATTSSTRTTASPASPASTPRPSPASPATT